MLILRQGRRGVTVKVLLVEVWQLARTACGETGARACAREDAGSSSGVSGSEDGAGGGHEHRLGHRLRFRFWGDMDMEEELFFTREAVDAEVGDSCG